MNWGNKIVVVFIGFAALIGTLVYSCMTQNFELVSADYYKDEIGYQKNIDGSSNASKISPLVISQINGNIEIKLPVEQINQPVTGKVWFYCATSSASDLKLPFITDKNGTMQIKRSLVSNANYLVKTSWQVNGKDYYNEQIFQLQ